jgi:hypothetical protein
MGALWIGNKIPRGVVLSERSQKYRRFAEECLQMAAKSEDEATRATFKFMAQVWLRLAHEYERLCAAPIREEFTSES